MSDERRLNDATPLEWDQASRYARGYEIVDDDYSLYEKTNCSYSMDDISIRQQDDPYIFRCSTDSLLFKDFNPRIEYKFREDELITEFSQYIDSTYSGHYGQGGLQSSEVIIDRGHGMGFFSGNVDKYNGRYGKKGETPDDHRKDILKIIHYGFLMLYEHDRTNGNNTL